MTSREEYNSYGKALEELRGLKTSPITVKILEYV